MLGRREAVRIGMAGATAVAAGALPSVARERDAAWRVWAYTTKPVRGGYYPRAAAVDVGLLNPHHWPVNDWLVINMLYEKLLIIDGAYRPVPSSRNRGRSRIR
jgi:hypothetical protein